MEKIKQVSLEELIDAIKKLYNMGIPINKIKNTDTLQSLAEQYNIPVQSFELDNRFDKIGSKIIRLKSAYRPSNAVRVPSEEDREMLEKMGLKFEREDTIQIFVDKMKLLAAHGVRTELLSINDTVWKLVVDKSNLSPDLIDELDLEYDDKIGKKKSSITQMCRGKIQGNLPTVGQIEELRKLGLQFEVLVDLPETRKSKNIDKHRRDTIQDFIEKMKLLKDNGVQVSLLTSEDELIDLLRKSNIDEELIDRLDGAKGLHFSSNDKIGKKFIEIRQVYRGKKSGVRPTEKQEKEIVELGLDLYKEIRVKSEKAKQELIAKQNARIAREEKRKQRELEKQKRLQEAEEKRKRKLEAKAVQERKRKEKLKKKKEKAQKVKRKTQKKKKTEPKPRKIKRRIETAQDFIMVMKVLKENGVDITEISPSDTFETLLSKSEKSVELVEKLGFSPKYQIGKIKGNLAGSYKGRSNSKFSKPTKEEVEEIARLGIDLEESQLVKRFIGKMKLLQENGIDVSNITSFSTIGKIAKQSYKTDDFVRSIGLNPDEPIGYILHSVRSANRDIGRNAKPSKLQIQQLEELGINIENPSRGRSNKQDIHLLEMLSKKGLYIFRTQKDETLKQYMDRIGFYIKNVEEYENVPIDKIVKKVKQACRKKGTWLSDEQLETLEKMGIKVKADIRTGTEKFIDLLERLRDINVDVTKITMDGNFTIRDLARKSDITTEQLINARIDPTIHIGSLKKQIAGAYRGVASYKDAPTQEQVQQLLEMGISLERQHVFDGNDVGKAGFGTPVEICEAAQRDLNTRIKEPNKGVR